MLVDTQNVISNLRNSHTNKKHNEFLCFLYFYGCYVKYYKILLTSKLVVLKIYGTNLK